MDSVVNVETSDTMCEIANDLKKNKLQLQSSETSKLWLAYQKMVQTVCKLIAADRTSSWKLHLEAIQECLVIVAAAGHLNYLKSGYKYLQDMLKLPSDNPSVYELFQKVQFVVRRSDQCWAGLGSDLMIEQVLMHSIKSRGGLKRGSGLTEIQQAIWLNSMPVCYLYNLAMQDYSKVLFETSKQHKEVGESRQSRDICDFQKIIECMKPISPFDSDTSFRNIITGVTADPSVNVHELHSIGTKIINKMVGKPVYTYYAKRSDRAKTLGSASAVTSAEKTLT
ncbi:hypothetical protein PR048_023185 [Dryococelus australis]|uniref:Uncharacterized protein n=1 Tax=Dryococelus australis TaxID=614101 RepID=A0ABQ9GTD3_9NEOP|nr:hypothetical protein PR048_023185 [Dryococelus australis]